MAYYRESENFFDKFGNRDLGFLYLTLKSNFGVITPESYLNDQNWMVAALLIEMFKNMSYIINLFTQDKPISSLVSFHISCLFRYSYRYVKETGCDDAKVMSLIREKVLLPKGVNTIEDFYTVMLMDSHEYTRWSLMVAIDFADPETYTDDILPKLHSHVLDLIQRLQQKPKLVQERESILFLYIIVAKVRMILERKLEKKQSDSAIPICLVEIIEHLVCMSDSFKYLTDDRFQRILRMNKSICPIILDQYDGVLYKFSDLHSRLEALQEHATH